MDYNKLILRRKPIVIPYLVFDDWILSNQGLQDPVTGKIYTPGVISLIEWKSRFYDRGKRNDPHPFTDRMVCLDGYELSEF